MAGVVTAVCYSLNNIIIYWTFYKKMLSISAGPYLSVSITQRWGLENLPLSSHALASFRGSLGFQCTTTLQAQQKKNPHLRESFCQLSAYVELLYTLLLLLLLLWFSWDDH